jgi:AsmA-like C-terminal region
MKNSKKILIGVAVIVGVLVILPFLIPTQTYLQKAEALASEKLGVPVVIGSANLFLIPSPRIALNDIVVGKHEELKVEKLVVIPTISSLFSANKTLDLNITRPVINKAALDFVSALSAKKSVDNQPVGVRLRHVAVDEILLVMPDAKYPMMNAEATFTEAYKLESAKLETIDGKLEAKLTPRTTPNGDEHLIIVNVNKWALPVGLPLLVDAGKLEMYLKDTRLEIPKIDLALYGGKLTGNAVLTWPEIEGLKSWRMNGKLVVANLAVKEPSRLVSKSVFLSGLLFGNGNFSSNAKKVSQLDDNLRANFKFRVNNGVLHGLDLVKVASLLVKQNKSGGETQFDTFSGLLDVTGKQYHLRDLNISSGLLVAAGQVKVKPNKSLDGNVVVDIKAGMGLAGIPLQVSGIVSNPVVMPSKAALAGALAGTALMPGIGTSVGAKVGAKTGETLDKLKGLFGDK